MDTLINRGGEVKSLGNGKFGGYLVTFSDASNPDLAGDFFTADTDFGVDWEGGEVKTAVLYAHGMDAKMGKARLGSGTMTKDDVGVWVEAQLQERTDYEKAIAGMAAKHKLGWSSGTASHLVDREAVGSAFKITCWPLGLDASLTPSPCEPKNNCLPLKSWAATQEVKEYFTKDYFGDRLPVQLTVAALSTLQDQFWYRVTDTLWGYSKDSDEPLTVPEQLTEITQGFEDYQKLALQTITALLSGPAEPLEIKAAFGQMFTKQMLLSGKGGLPAGLPLAEELDAALSAVKAVTARAAEANDIRSKKSGRVLSSASLTKIKAAHGALDDLITLCEKGGKPTKDADLNAADLAETETLRLRTETQRLQSRLPRALISL